MAREKIKARDAAKRQTVREEVAKHYAAVVEAAKLAKETLEYVKKYVEGQGLSAEDDCDEAIEAIDKALSDLGEARRV